MTFVSKEGNVSYANAKELGVVQWQILEKLIPGYGVKFFFFGTFMPHLRWDIAGGVSHEQVDTIDMQEAEKLIDLLLNASQCATPTPF